MGFNQLYSDHQRLQMRADGAPPGVLKSEHQLAASLIAGRIGSMQRALGAPGARAWEVLATAEPEALEDGESTLPDALDAEQDRRKREITQLALLLLGTESAATFLEQPNSHLGARPLELAIASPEGRDRVEAELGRLISHPVC